jgi:uncharacterized protein YaaW (UPF0174 family)
MKSILLTCEAHDFEYLCEILDGHLALTSSHTRRRELLRDYQRTRDIQLRKQLAALIDEQIRYFGSSNLAYLGRQLFGGNSGVSSEEIINDVCARLGVTIKIGGTTAYKLQKLIKAVAEKELADLAPVQLRSLCIALGVPESSTAQIVELIGRQRGMSVVAALLQVLGPVVTLSLVQTLIIQLIASMTGHESFGDATTTRRSGWLGMRSLSGAARMLDPQGPAFRKTVPVCLYLGVVALRDESAAGERFFNA